MTEPPAIGVPRDPPPSGVGADALCLAWLGACALLIVGRVGTDLARWLDQPAHAAEIVALARESTNGWVDVAFCGFDVTMFHAPWIAGAAVALVRLGVPIEAVILGLSMLGLVALPLACFVTLRRSLPPAPAMLLALALMLRPEGIVSVQSPLGGMAPFALALAGFAWLLGRLGRVGPRDGGHLASVAMAACTAVACHVLGAVLVVAALVSARLGHGGARADARERSRDAWAATLGAAIAAPAWLPLIASHAWLAPLTTPLGTGEVMRALLVGSAHDETSSVVMRASVPIALVVGAAPAVLFRRARRDATPVMGAWLVLAALVVGVGLAPHVPALGVYGLRTVPLVRLGLVLTATPFVAWAWARASARARALATSVAIALTLGGSAAWGSALRAHVPSAVSADAREIDALFDWLAAHRTRSWGRVALQDTFRASAWPGPTGESHALARAHERTGVDAVGGFYASFPAPTSTWTRSEHDRLFDHPVRTDADVTRVLSRMAVAGATHLVLVEPSQRALFAARPELSLAYASDRISVWSRRAATRALVSVEGGTLRDARVDVPGHARLTLDVAALPALVTLRESFHPAWSLAGGGRLAPDADGLMTIRDLPAGSHVLTLHYAPSRWPWALSPLAALALVRLVLASRRPFGDRRLR